MKEIALEDIKEKVHPYAVETIIRLTTGKCKGIKFFFTAVNDFASNLPEVGTVFGDHISGDTVYEIDIKYTDILEDVSGEDGVDIYETERLYDGMTIVPRREFDETYFKEDIFGFYAIDGKFYEKEQSK